MRPSVPLIALGVAGAALVAGVALSMLGDIGIDLGLGGGGDDTLVFADGPADFARLEREHPVGRAALAALTPEAVRALDQMRLDQLYARLPAGPVPEGRYEVTLFGTGEARDGERLAGAMGGLARSLPGETADFVIRTGTALYGQRQFEGQTMRALADDFDPVRILVNEVSALQGVSPDYRDFPAVDVPRDGLLGLIFSTRKAYVLFPVRVACGQSLLDPRRESHIADHIRNETMEGYRRIADVLVGPSGLAIREEFRMVRPGLYLGRAYAARRFVGNVLLWRAEGDEAALEAFSDGDGDPGPCWPGDMKRAAG